MLHADPLPFGTSLNYTILGEAGSDSICNISDDFKHCRLTLQINTSLFSVFCPHSHAYRKTFR